MLPIATALWRVDGRMGTCLRAENMSFGRPVRPGLWAGPASLCSGLQNSDAPTTQSRPQARSRSSQSLGFLICEMGQVLCMRESWDQGGRLRGLGLDVTGGFTRPSWEGSVWL